MTEKPSIAFSSFLYEFNLQGKERGEGFSKTTLLQLTNNDLEKAEDLLIESIDEIRSVDALGFICSRKAIPHLMTRYPCSKGRYRIVLACALHKMSIITDDEYLKVLKEIIITGNIDVKKTALNFLTEYKTIDVINIVLDLMNSETDSNFLSFAYGLLLEDILGLFDDKSFFQSRYRPLLLRIVSKEDDERLHALKELNDIVMASINKEET